jgi:hypothetical protein
VQKIISRSNRKGGAEESPAVVYDKIVRLKVERDWVEKIFNGFRRKD